MCLCVAKLCIILYYFAAFLHSHDDTLIDRQGVSAVDVFSAVILSFGASVFFATLTSHRFLQNNLVYCCVPTFATMHCDGFRGSHTNSGIIC